MAPGGGRKIGRPSMRTVSSTPASTLPTPASTVPTPASAARMASTAMRPSASPSAVDEALPRLADKEAPGHKMGRPSTTRSSSPSTSEEALPQLADKEAPGPKVGRPSTARTGSLTIRSSSPSAGDEGLPRLADKVAPGPKPSRPSTARTATPYTEETLTDYERIRAQSIMRNNRMLQSLGATALKSIMSKRTSQNKTTTCDDPDPLYQPGDDECSLEISEQDTEHSPPKTHGKASKRVMAPEQPARMTRQRTKEALPTEEDALLPITEPDDQIQTEHEGEPSVRNAKRKPRLRVGRDLDRISRGLNTKITVVVPEGKTRPEVPMQAAKLASEAGIILRDQIPIFPHWKDYKKDKDLLDNYISKVTGSFIMDKNKKEVRDACKDLLKKGQRQMRNKLKAAHFDGVPLNQVTKKSPVATTSDAQWLELVKHWSTPNHMARCDTNRGNRRKVQFPQTTGSRCYVAQIALLKKEKFKDETPTAIDLFKACHCSSKTGYSVPVQEAIATMENMVHNPIEGQEAKNPTEAVAEVLSSPKFLENVGIQPRAMKRRSKSADDERVQNLEAQLQLEKQGAALVRDELDELKKMVVASEEARAKDKEKWEKESAETNALLRRLLSLKD